VSQARIYRLQRRHSRSQVAAECNPSRQIAWAERGKACDRGAVAWFIRTRLRPLTRVEALSISALAGPDSRSTSIFVTTGCVGQLHNEQNSVRLNSEGSISCSVRANMCA